MCGICGYAGFEPDEGLLARMTAALEHRGPDGEGRYRSGRVALGIRRLAIIDVAGGRQPILNEDETMAVVLNGEIYNYRALTRELEGRGHRFRTASDTETILHLYEERGAGCLEHLRGMFAFAIHDRRGGGETLFIARDRLGVKPLYYWARNGGLLFASEIKAILQCPDVPREPDLEAVDAYLDRRYVPAPRTMFAGIRRLPAGHWLLYRDGEARIERYWEPRFAGGPYEPDDHYRERFAGLFEETVRLHLESDVPVGAFLSGGVDSGATVATMSRLAGRPVETFSVGFEGSGDELGAARETARRLGCAHHEVVCRAEDLALLPKVVWHLDEPIGDAIVLPMYLLSRLAQGRVKVVLSGEGGDEVLAGYLFHKLLLWAGRYARRVPALVQRRLVKPVLACAPAGLLDRAFDYPGRLGERGRRKVLDYLDLLSGDARPEAGYRHLTSLFDARDKAELYAGEMRSLLCRRAPSPGAQRERARNGSDLHEILGLQYADWLPDNILTKADKMTMANGVEGRVPFVDHVLVEFLCQAPPHLKLRGLADKVLLRDYAERLLPGGPARRPKRAFYFPHERYLAAPAFRELLEACLSEERVRRRGLFDWPAVRRLRRSVEARDFLYAKQVLSLVMLELWFRIFVDREAGAA